jgi:hypothetical protein
MADAGPPNPVDAMRLSMMGEGAGESIDPDLSSPRSAPIDEVLPRQCPCSRAFDLRNAWWDLANSTAIKRKQGNTRFYPGSAPLIG